MRGYYLVSGILLILLTIDFAVTAPAPAQEKRRAGIDVSVVRMPEDSDALTMLGKSKRGDELSDLWLDYLRSDVEYSKVTKPESSATRPPPPPPPPGPADGQTKKQPPPPSSTDERLPDKKLPLLDILIS